MTFPRPENSAHAARSSILSNYRTGVMLHRWFIRPNIRTRRRVGQIILTVRPCVRRSYGRLLLDSRGEGDTAHRLQDMAMQSTTSGESR